MRRPAKRLLIFLVSLPLLVVGLALVYQAGMAQLEGETRTFWESVAWASETLTSTGYGKDAHWNHPAMVVFVSLVQLTGVSLVLLVFPLYLVPFFEERFEGRLSRRAPPERDYVLVYRFGPAVAGLIDTLTEAGTRTVVFEEDESTARRLQSRGQTVVFGRLEDGDPEPAVILRAWAIVVNGDDPDNGAFILTARQLGFRGPILALAEDPFHRAPMEAAGAEVVYTPAHVLAAALADRASERIVPRISGLAKLEGKLEVAEVRIDTDNPLVGKSLAEAGLERDSGATILGIWAESDMLTLPTPDYQLAPRTMLVVAGSPEAIERLGGQVTPLSTSGPIVIAGYGEVGRKVGQLLSDAEEKLIVIDRMQREGVTVVGNLFDAQVLRHAKVPEARAVVVALSDDASTMFATSVIRAVAPSVPIVARINRAENTERIRLAGADFSLSVSQVAAQLLSYHLLGLRHEARPHMRCRRFPVHKLDGLHPRDQRVRGSGVAIIGVQRDGQTLVDFPREFELHEGDEVFVCGLPEDLEDVESKL